MTEEAFAAIGVLATFAVAVFLIGLIVFAGIGSLKDWLRAKRDLTHGTENLIKTQRALIEANSKLSGRVTAIEYELRGD